MKNFIAIPAYKNKLLTLQTIEDCFNQDLKCEVVILDNSPDEELFDALKWLDIIILRSPQNLGVGASWNALCSYVFQIEDQSHVLLINNDVRLRPDLYSTLLKEHSRNSGGFISGVNVDSLESALGAKIEITKETPKGGPDFSCFLLQREFYEKVGPFDECFMAYREDNLYHWRCRLMGYRNYIYSIPIPYFQTGSETIKKNPEIAELNSKMWHFNGLLYEQITGGPVGSEKYYDSEIARKNWRTHLDEHLKLGST